MSNIFKSGDVLGQRYQIKEYLNEGGMQYVFVAHDLILNRLVALKTPKNISALKRFKRSATLSAKVNHPNVAKTLDYFETDDRPFLIEELIEGTDLKASLLKQMKTVDPYLGARIFHHLAKGLAAAHHVGVIHRDLKPTNIMVSSDIGLSTIKITDFGIAIMTKEVLDEALDSQGGEESITASQTAMGALPYMSPEAIETPKQVKVSTDIWSIGAMMFELLTGDKPFGSGLKAVTKITSGTPPEFPAHITQKGQFAPLAQQIIHLILGCLQKDPNTRPTADQLVEACGNLCYPIALRELGTIRLIKYQAWGFITANQNNEDVFFHLDSVYGSRPTIGDHVIFSRFPGGGASRAHPVIKLHNE